jgi:hypothetical protein
LASSSNCLARRPSTEGRYIGLDRMAAREGI